VCPYLVNVKKLEYDKSFEILKIWLENCNHLRNLDFNSDIEIKAKLKYVKHYNPISIKKMKDDNKNLNLLLRQSYRYQPYNLVKILLIVRFKIKDN
jgi:hypothetical protein